MFTLETAAAGHAVELGPTDGSFDSCAGRRSARALSAPNTRRRLGSAFGIA